MSAFAIRRLALGAAVALLAPLWCRPSTVVQAIDTTGAVVGLAPSGTGSAPTIRRQAGGGWWTTGTRVEQGRALVAPGIVAFLSLLRLVSWSTLSSLQPSTSPLVRRRGVLTLRAPPLPV